MNSAKRTLTKDALRSRMLGIPLIQTSELEEMAPLGRGGFASVFQARWQGRKVAVKIFNIDKTLLSEDELVPLKVDRPVTIARGLRLRFEMQHEARILRYMKDNLGRLYETSDRPTPTLHGWCLIGQNKHPALVMSLEGPCVEYTKKEGVYQFHHRIPDDLTPLDLFAQLFRTYQPFFLAGVVHRDLKASAVHISDEGLLRFIDFNLSSKHCEKEETATDCGTRTENISMMLERGEVSRSELPENDLYALAVLALRWAHEERCSILPLDELLCEGNLAAVKRHLLDNCAPEVSRNDLVQFLELALPILEYKLSVPEVDRRLSKMVPGYRTLRHLQDFLDDYEMDGVSTRASSVSRSSSSRSPSPSRKRRRCM